MQLTFDLAAAESGSPPTKPSALLRGADIDLRAAPTKAPVKTILSASSKETRDAKEAQDSKGVVVLSIGELTRKIKYLLEDQVGTVRVEGEISNYRQVASSGHHYFSLKDDTAVLACVLFARSAQTLREVKLANGLAVQATGEISVYERSGQYQLVVRFLQPAGVGVLQARYEALKRRLEAEGLFSVERKRPLPRFLRRIGLVTSPSGAAIRDFLQILWRRHPGIEVILHPVPVQGAGAAQKIAEAVATLNALPEGQRPEVLVLTRGGGSLEDLWEFNEESVARAVAASALPVVSAVGHEIDVTLCDFAADLRAPTPSAAAELLSADAAEQRQRIVVMRQRLDRLMQRAWRQRRDHLQAIAESAALRRPERWLRDRMQELDHREERLRSLVRRQLQNREDNLARRAEILRLHHPARWIAARQQEVENRRQRFLYWAVPTLRRWQEALASRAQVLKAFDPTSTLARGYALVFDEKGNLITTAQAARKAPLLKTRFVDGEVTSRSV